MLNRLGINNLEVRLKRDFDQTDGLIIPGGESTTIGKLAVMYDLLDPIRERAAQGYPIYGTCAGAIVLAKQVNGSGLDQPVIGALDVTIQRNAFGRQVDSFETDVLLSVLDDCPFHAVFIRAPIIKEIGPGVRVIGRLADGTVVAAQEGNLLATSFHPELTDDGRIHRYFANLVETSR